MTTLATTPVAALPPAVTPRRWLALALLAVADFVVVLDVTIVNIALPSIGRDLHASTTGLSWVVSAYVLAFGGLLLLGGRLGDLFGRRRVFIGGLVVFGLASLAGGLSHSIGALIAFRALQGAGAAALAPAARGIVTTLFEEGPDRSKALGIWAAVAGSGGVVGVILGGVLTSGLGWQWVLWVNVPVALGAAALAPALIAESTAGTAERSVDGVGALLGTGGLVTVLYALVGAADAGWGSLRTVGLLALGAALLAAFAWVEGRVRVPLVPRGLLRNAQVRGANLAMLLLAGAMVGMFFILSLYQQQSLGYSALKTGLLQLPLGLVLVAVAGLAGPFTERIGAKPVLLAGLATFTAGIGWLSRVPLHGTFLADLLGPTLIIGVGLALSFVALTIASTSGVPADRSGVAAGLINMTQQVGGAVGLAVLAAVASSQLHGSASHVAINNGFRAALLVATGLAAAATILAAVALPGRHDRSGLGHAVPVLAPAAVPSA